MPVGVRRDFLPFTKGEACVWARRFRKLGFSPVTMHQIAAGSFCLRCNFPCNLIDLPEDLSLYLFNLEEDYDPVRWIRTHFDAKVEYAKFRVVRLGMGSKPLRLRQQRHDPIGNESSIIPAKRIAYDSDDWPGTQRHPDWDRYMRPSDGRD